MAVLPPATWKYLEVSSMATKRLFHGHSRAVDELTRGPEGEGDEDDQRRNEDIGDLPDRRGKDCRLGWDLRLPDEKADGEREREDEWRNECSRVPSLDRTLGESQDEGDQSAHHKEHTDEVESLPLGSRVVVLNVCAEGKEKDGHDGEGETDDGHESEEPVV